MDEVKVPINGFDMSLLSENKYDESIGDIHLMGSDLFKVRAVDNYIVFKTKDEFNKFATHIKNLESLINERKTVGVWKFRTYAVGYDFPVYYTFGTVIDRYEIDYNELYKFPSTYALSPDEDIVTAFNAKQAEDTWLSLGRMRNEDTCISSLVSVEKLELS